MQLLLPSLCALLLVPGGNAFVKQTASAVIAAVAINISPLLQPLLPQPADVTVAKEKKERFYIGGGIHKEEPLLAKEKKERFYIGGGIHKEEPLLAKEKKERFYIGNGIHRDFNA